MKVLVLVHEDLIPPADTTKKNANPDAPWITEFEVINALNESGHNVKVLGVYDDLKIIRKAVEEFKPKIVFNLLEEFKGEAIFDQNVVSYLELLGVPYTGCNPKGLILARDKALSKKILTYHKIKTPKFQVFPKNKKKIKVKIKSYPIIVKCLNEESSLGISQASVVYNEEKLLERVNFIHENFHTDAICEEFIEGKEYFVGVYGNYQVKTLPVWALNFDQAKDPDKEFYSTSAKFNVKYRKRKGISTAKAELESEMEKKCQLAAKKAYKVLGLNGYARMDMRVDKEGNIYMLEANPNPDISAVEDFSKSANATGLSYQDVLNKILKLGKQWTPSY